MTNHFFSMLMYMDDVSILKEYVPKQHWPHMIGKPTITQETGPGISAYHGFEVQKVYYEFGDKSAAQAQTLILPALVNKNGANGLVQISVILHY